MYKNGLIVKVTAEDFAKKEIDEKLNIIFQVVKDQQKICNNTVQRYDKHFEQCDDLVESCNDAVEVVTEKIKQYAKPMQENIAEIVEQKLKELAIPRIYNKKALGIGAAAGGGSAVGIWEGIKYIIDWVRGTL